MAICKQCLGTVSHINNTLVKCDYCGKLYSVVNGELSEANKSQIYDSAFVKAKSQNIKMVQEAAELFDALDLYKDSEIKLIECRDFMRKQKALEEERRLEERQRAEEEKAENHRLAAQKEKVARKIRVYIARTILCVIIIVTIVCIFYLTKKTKYDKAMELYTQEQYEEALEKFSALGDYSDSETFAKEISNLIVERDNYYAQGVSYFNSGLYEKSIEQLNNVPDYLDASDYIERAADALYQEASELFENEEYMTAKEKLCAIPIGCGVYTSAQTLLIQTEESLLEQERAINYEAAVNYYGEGKYDTAQQLFISLGNYEDVQTYLSTIGTMYYNEAQGLYDAGSYVECADKLEYIDTVDEWAEYTVALELKQQATDVYYNLVMEEAKKICRSDGDAAMISYLNSTVCSILSEQDVAILKESCHVESIPLSELEPYATGEHGIYMNHRLKDTLGNIYTDALVGVGSEVYGENSNTYFVDKMYVLFSATVGVYAGKGENARGIIRIYGDGILLWSEENIKVNTKPYLIQVDISGVEDLKIEMYGMDGGMNNFINVMLVDPMLSE